MPEDPILALILLALVSSASRFRIVFALPLHSTQFLAGRSHAPLCVTGFAALMVAIR